MATLAYRKHTERCSCVVKGRRGEDKTEMGHPSVGADGANAAPTGQAIAEQLLVTSGA